MSETLWRREGDRAGLLAATLGSFQVYRGCVIARLDGKLRVRFDESEHWGDTGGVIDIVDDGTTFPAGTRVGDRLFAALPYSRPA